MDDEYYYYHPPEPSPEERRRQAEATAKTASLFVRLLYQIFVLFILFIPGFFCAYLILSIYAPLLGNPRDWNYFWWLIGLVYFLECLIFLLKGWYMSLKEGGYGLWRFLWAICVGYCFAAPAFLLLFLLAEIFTTRSTHGPSPVWIILGVASTPILGWVIYKRYQLGADSAPKWMGWAYRLGRLIPNDE